MPSLDLAPLPVGEISRLYVEIIKNSLSQPVACPVIVAKGQKPGPVLLLTAAVHGNELNGIPVIHRLFSKLDARKLSGTVVGVCIVNVPAFQQRQRRFFERVDLNKIFPGRPGGSSYQAYAHNFVERVLSHADYLVDLHTASSGRVNSFYIRADLHDTEAREMAILQRPQIILHNPASDKTLRGHAMSLGIPAITLELRDPQRFQQDVIRRTLIGIRALMRHLAMLKGKKRKSEYPAPIFCEDSDWIYTISGGLLEVLPDLGATIGKGELIATIKDPFGQLIDEYHAPAGGVVIGKSTDPVAETGARILHLGQISS